MSRSRIFNAAAPRGTPGEVEGPGEPAGEPLPQPAATTTAARATRRRDRIIDRITTAGRRASGGCSPVRTAVQTLTLMPRGASIEGDVVGIRVAAGALLDDLEDDVVEEGARAEAEPIGRHPARPERLVEHDEVLDRLLRRPDPARRLHPDRPARLALEVADRLEHDERDRERRRGCHLARRRLD